jgi:hypothetical protein
LCFWGILIRLVTGASWVDIEAILEHRVSDTTLRARRDEWITAGVFERLKAEATAAFDRIVGLDLSEVSLDGSLHKAPYGGEGTGPNPTDRAKLGWKWSVASERHGVPIGWAIDGANRNDVRMLIPTIEAVADAGLLADVARRHESQSGRRLVLLARIPDRPGSLALLLSLVGRQGANLLDVEHLREGFDLHVRESAVQLVMETRGPAHALEVTAAVREAGYTEPSALR